ncbi:MAG: phage tail protein [Pseudomonadota bacterium]
MPTFREDPYPNHSFLIEIGGIIGDPQSVVAGFSEVSGLDIEQGYIGYRNGNDRRLTKRQVPGLVSFSPIVLRRGVTGTDNLWRWMEQFNEGSGQAQAARITLLNEAREAVMSWAVINARPAKLTGPTLDACANAVAIETLELSHEGLSLVD